MENLSDNNLTELINCLWDLKNTIKKDYLHIDELVSVATKKNIDNQLKKAQKEFERRQELCEY